MTVTDMLFLSLKNPVRWCTSISLIKDIQ